jgi:hypothetical protein
MGHRRLRGIAALGLAIAVLAGGAPALAEPEDRIPAVTRRHEPEKAGHPLRVIAYLMHPIGLLLDTLLFRPADWLINHEPMRTIFGHED